MKFILAEELKSAAKIFTLVFARQAFYGKAIFFSGERQL
jgi:hypothetical protein